MNKSRNKSPINSILSKENALEQLCAKVINLVNNFILSSIGSLVHSQDIEKKEYDSTINCASKGEHLVVKVPKIPLLQAISLFIKV